MGKTLTAENVLQELRAEEQRARQLKSAAVAKRDQFAEEGVNLALKANRDQFDELDNMFKAADEAESNVQEMQVALDRLRAMDAASGPAAGSAFGRAPEMGAQAQPRRLMSIGERFTGSDAFVSLAKRGAFNSDAALQAAVPSLSPVEILSRDEMAAILRGGGFHATEITGASATSAGPFVQNDLQPGFVRYMTKAPRLLNIVGQGRTDSDTVEYVTQSAPTNNTDGKPEGTQSPEAVIAFATATVAVEDYSQFVPISRRALADAANIQTIIEEELLALLLDNVEDDLASGAGSSNDVEGIYTAVSQAQALGGDTRPDAIHKAITQIRTAAGVYMDPDYIGVHPDDYESLILEIDANGQYLMGPPSMAGSRTIWGIPFVVSPVFTSGTPLVGNFARGARFWLRQGAEVTMGLDGNDFTTRRVTLLANMRFAFKTIRITAFTEVTGF